VGSRRPTDVRGNGTPWRTSTLELIRCLGASAEPSPADVARRDRFPRTQDAEAFRQTPERPFHGRTALRMAGVALTGSDSNQAVAFLPRDLQVTLGRGPPIAEYCWFALRARRAARRQSHSLIPRGRRNRTIEVRGSLDRPRDPRTLHSGISRSTSNRTDSNDSPNQHQTDDRTQAFVQASAVDPLVQLLRPSSPSLSLQKMAATSTPTNIRDEHQLRALVSRVMEVQM
jgi:hypothetical protein